ncbi:hypothetical protein Poli38472_013516 [Pythium oligandrum]|uniref:ANK_REP_REGION domain-containing protein n=1 Tax=Pythium oligandrum TaxID=41045 RepID=A0A8K1C7L8_PYTOL|nr:hypothetical protein Poli38472_013516 [Pythium oligandrum]|eukprot:TMW58042.1 hypothetical protein Poli38472_013516 [Pythium oligandrum]
MPHEAERVRLCFRGERSPMDEMKWLQRLKERDPTSAANVVANGQLLMELARDGQVRALHMAMEHMQEDHVLSFYAVRMFRVACYERRLDVLRFMLANGFDLEQTCMRDVLHTLVEKIAQDDEASHDTWQPVLRLLLDAGVDVNWQRPGDLYTVLHVACRSNLYAITYLLLIYGADVNAIALNDDMPLLCAERVNTAVLSPRALASHRELVSLLLDAQARRTWRRPASTSSPPASSSSLSIQSCVTSFASISLGIQLDTTELFEQSASTLFHQ